VNDIGAFDSENRWISENDQKFKHGVYVSIWSEPFKPRELCVHDPRTNLTVKKTLPYSWVNAEVVKPYFRKAMQEIGKARELGR